MPRTETGNYLRLETHGRDPKELLSLHAQELAAFRSARGVEVRSATLNEVSAEMLTGQKLMLEQQKGAGAAIAMPLGLFVLPSTSAFTVLRHSPKGLFIAPILICMSALVY